MDSKHLSILAIAAAVSLVTAGLVHSAYDTWTQEKLDGTLLFPQFDQAGATVDRVKLQQGEVTLTLTKDKAGGWSLLERGGYPVDGKKVRDLLVKVARAELVETKTRDPKRYDLLELGDPAKAGTTARLLRLSSAGGKVLGEVVVGKRRQSAFGAGKSGSYVRKPGDAQTWLSSSVIRLPMEVSDWVKPVFFQLPLDKIKAIKLSPPDGAPVDLVLAQNTAADGGKQAKAKDGKKPEPKFRFASVPDGKTTKDGVDATVMVKALETLEMTDVRKAEGANVPNTASRIPVTVELKNGLKLEASVLKIGDDERWVSIKVLSDGSDTETANKLREKLHDWQFKIADWRSRQIFKTAAEMFEDKTPAQPATERAPVKPPAGLEQAPARQ